MLFLLLTLTACDDGTTESTPSTTSAAASPLIWEVHEIACNELDRYVVPAPRVGLASYTVLEHITNTQGESRAKAQIEAVPEIRTDTESWEFNCDGYGGYLLVVTYAYVAE